MIDRLLPVHDDPAARSAREQAAGATRPRRQIDVTGSGRVALERLGDDAVEHDIHPGDLTGAQPRLDDDDRERVRAPFHCAAWRAACLDAEGADHGRGTARL